MAGSLPSSGAVVAWHPEEAERPGPHFTVIVPVLDGGEPFRLCLAALRTGSFQDYELLVVDDGCSDGSPEAALAAGARLLMTGGRRGPATARNLAASEARGEWLAFIDADCVPHHDTLERMAAVIATHPETDAIFGSYDDEPAASTFVAQYKNLFHHYIHHQAEPEGFTFWAGCGAIRRRTFLALGGFDAARYPRPSIEDIELGYRMRAAGHRILVAKEVQVTHHKRWTLHSLLRADIFDRGVPWARLIASRGAVAPDLNLRWHHRLSGALTPLGLVAAAIAPVAPVAAWAAGACALALLVLNRDVYSFFVAKRGALFALRVVPMHWLYYLYADVAFAVGTALGLADRFRPRNGRNGS